MNKTEFINALAEYADCTKVAAVAMYDHVFGCLADVLSKGEEVTVSGLGKWSVKEIVEHTGRNPATGESITIPATKRISFRAASSVRAALNDK